MHNQNNFPAWLLEGPDWDELRAKSSAAERSESSGPQERGDQPDQRTEATHITRTPAPLNRGAGSEPKLINQVRTLVLGQLLDRVAWDLQEKRFARPQLSEAQHNKFPRGRWT